MKFVVDVSLSPKWAGFLREAGHEAAHWSEIGPQNASDRTIADWAQSRGYAVLTADLDFGALLARTGASGPSVLLLRSKNTRHTAMGSRTLTAVSAAHEELVAGALMMLDEQRSRLTLLPFEV